MCEQVRVVKVTPEARAQVIRAALNGRLVQAKMTAGQRRAAQAAREAS
jgi:hypothetical protein